jgi:hypothetical protein
MIGTPFRGRVGAAPLPGLASRFDGGGNILPLYALIMKLGKIDDII